MSRFYPTQRTGSLSLLVFASTAIATSLSAQVAGSVHAVAPPQVQASERTTTITLDGKLDEAAWGSVTPATEFTQQDPHEGSPATQRTEVRFLFDADALYIGARMYDSLGAEGVRTRLARRDQETEGDHIQIVFDTFHDHTGRTIFRVNPSGVKYDAGQATPFADPSWDPVWEVATAIDSLGWTAELRIPFSQLRFSGDTDQVWGMQIWRFVERLNETSMWSFWKRDEAGGPARFGHLDGMRITGRRRSVELMPYTVARASYIEPKEPGNPFQDARAYDWRVGGDIKALLTSNFTLDATLNPDFGQVEVDPAVVNLSAFETFYPERRPFFVEGSGLFGFGGFNCFFCSNVSSMSLFYSRRIGRRPQGSLPSSVEYSEIPENTAILGAAKVTGRTANGYQVGLLNALTRAENALVVGPDGHHLEREVEPLTNYLVGRTRRNFRGGNVVVGAIATSVARRIEYDSLARLVPRHAEAAGFDWSVSWKDRTYNFMGNLALSQASGDTSAIHRLQRSSARYFQRPDRGHGSNGLFSDALDPSMTALRGYGGYMRLAKSAGNVLWESAVNFRSPGFEVNDLAFLTRADYVWMNANVLRQWTTPTPYFRRATIIGGAQQQFNYDGDRTDQQFQVFGALDLRNYWSFSTFLIVRPEVYDDRLTRGGPVVRQAAGWSYHINLSTDSRKAVVLSTNPNYFQSADGAHSYSANLDARFKPASNISLSLGPSYRRGESTTQFVKTFDDSAATHFHGRRMVFADLTQHTLSMDTRLGLTFTPTLTLELFAQPFVASGDYSSFKEFTAPRALEKTSYDAAQLMAIRSGNGHDSVYVLDPDRNATTENFTFDNPDFNLRSLRGNAVLRWEYRPGSTLFFVWQQQRSDSETLGKFDFGRDAGAVFQQRPDNIFVVKASYWFGR